MKINAVIAIGLLGATTAFVPQPTPVAQRALVSSPLNAFSFLTAPKTKSTGIYEGWFAALDNLTHPSSYNPPTGKLDDSPYMLVAGAPLL